MRTSIFAVLIPLLAACNVTNVESRETRKDEPRAASAEAEPRSAVSPTPKLVRRRDFSGIPLRGTTEPTSTFHRCWKSSDAAEGVTDAMMSCLGDEIELQDARLNATYRVVIDTLEGRRRAELRNSQRTWIANRDQACDALAMEAGDGSLGGVAYSECILDFTIERAVWLENYS